MTTTPDVPNIPDKPNSANNGWPTLPNIAPPKLPGYAVLVLTYIVTGLTISDNSFSSPYKEIASAIIALAGTWLGIFPINSVIKLHAGLHYMQGRVDGASVANAVPKNTEGK